MLTGSIDIPGLGINLPFNGGFELMKHSCGEEIDPAALLAEVPAASGPPVAVHVAAAAS